MQEKCGSDVSKYHMLRYWIGGYFDESSATWKWDGINKDMPSAETFKAKLSKNWDDWKVPQWVETE